MRVVNSSLAYLLIDRINELLNIEMKHTVNHNAPNSNSILKLSGQIVHDFLDISPPNAIVLLSDRLMIFQAPTITDYAMKENAVLYDLDAVTVCFIAVNLRHGAPMDENQCPFSYAVPGSDNELTLCTSPTLRVLIHGKRRY